MTFLLVELGRGREGERERESKHMEFGNSETTLVIKLWSDDAAESGCEACISQ